MRQLIISSRGGCSSVGRVQDCDSCCRGFEPHQSPHIRQQFSLASQERGFFVGGACRQSVGKLHKSSGPLPNWFCNSDLTDHRVDLRTPMWHLTTAPVSITVLHSLLRYLGIGSNVGEFRLRLRMSAVGHQNPPSQTPTVPPPPRFGHHVPVPVLAVIRSAEPAPHSQNIKIR